LTDGGQKRSIRRKKKASGVMGRPIWSVSTGGTSLRAAEGGVQEAPSYLPHVSGALVAPPARSSSCWASPVSFFTVFSFSILFFIKNKICKKVFRSEKYLNLKIIQIR
jgi:hypothetical protein